MAEDDEPIIASGIAIAPHPTEATASVLTLVVGDHRVSFAIDTTTLVAMCRHVLDSAVPIDPPQQH